MLSLMDIKETLDFFKKLPNRVKLKCLTDNFIQDYDKAFKTIKESLKKQIKLEVEEGTEGGFDFYCQCGNYLCDVKNKTINYCPKCGQKLDWD